MKIGVGPLWIEAFPIRKWRERRQAKKAAKTGDYAPESPGGEFWDWSATGAEGKAMNEQIASVIRTVIKSAGGGLVGAGLVTSGELEVLAGAAAVVIGLVWSWYAKRKAA